MTNPQETMEALGLSVRAEFVPFSKSRNAKPDPSTSELSLNWRVQVLRNGSPFIETDYSQGIGHAPTYKASVRALGGANSLMRFEALKYEAENGRFHASRGSVMIGGCAIDPPSAADVLYALSLDASVLDSATFEDWAGDLGYDPDSRAAEKIYRACLEIALKMRAAIGDSGLEQLREAFQDY